MAVESVGTPSPEAPGTTSSRSAEDPVASGPAAGETERDERGARTPGPGEEPPTGQSPGEEPGSGQQSTHRRESQGDTRDRSAFEAAIACSFCLKSPSQVRAMVAGPGVFICDECVELSRVIIADRQQHRDYVANWEHQLSDEDLLAHLPKVAAAGEQAERHLASWVRKARARGITWTRIGAALGMTRQSAWGRFSGED